MMVGGFVFLLCCINWGEKAKGLFVLTGSYLQGKVYAKIKQVAEKLAGAQGTDGAWRYCFESGTVTDAYMIILLRHLNIRDEAYISNWLTE
jgi:hypothetical protein